MAALYAFALNALAVALAVLLVPVLLIVSAVLWFKADEDEQA